MKKRSIKLMLLAIAASLTIAACGGDPKDPEVTELLPEPDGIGISQPGEGDGGDGDTATEEDVIPEGMYRSELTNEIISLDLKDQRPIACMVDNEKDALPHFGTSKADIVYEMMNSTANGRITRLMCIMKDWKSIEQLGSVRSTRPTNIMIAAEYNAILCHDGGPLYINDYIKKDYTNNLSGGFARFPNGKLTEYTEYITYDSYMNPETGANFDGLGTRIQKAGYSETYNDHYDGEHFQFSWKDISLEETQPDAFDAKDVTLPFPHNSSELHYNAETGLYEYYEYGQKYVDAGNDNAPLAFKNVIIQKCSFSQLDDHGYLVYNVLVGQPWDGYYLTGGKAIPIKWLKYGESDRTVFMYSDESHLVLNTGKTYIGIVPDDSWNQLEIK